MPSEVSNSVGLKARVRETSGIGSRSKFYAWILGPALWYLDSNYWLSPTSRAIIERQDQILIYINICFGVSSWFFGILSSVWWWNKNRDGVPKGWRELWIGDDHAPMVIPQWVWQDACQINCHFHQFWHWPLCRNLKRIKYDIFILLIACRHYVRTFDSRRFFVIDTFSKPVNLSPYYFRFRVRIIPPSVVFRWMLENRNACVINFDFFRRYVLTY